jgi:PKD repeat protein/murein DD-endopeptidase MepM/ murein hydrolase activator NlpD
MTLFRGFFSRVFLCLLLTAAGFAVQAANTDPDTTWPLCGRITASPPGGWVDSDGCPAVRAGDAAYSDEPLSSTYGPRPLASESNRYDFHRGVDIATPIGTPFFAITDGSVEIAGNNASYSDPLVKLRHFRPGESSCSPNGCYHSYYLHIDSWVVSEDDQVVKGQLLGYTGASSSGFEHVHFEVRDAPDFDVFSAWSRDAIHPLSVVPYSAGNTTTISFNAVDFAVPGSGLVDLTLTSNRFDLVSVDLALFDDSHQLLAQKGDTPDANGYLVQPASFDMEAWNFMYSHKDSSNFQWEIYGTGGVNECPYHADHGASYDAGVHMDAQHSGNALEGLFNGLHIRTQKYWPSDVDDYQVDLEFSALEGPVACVEVTALFASGDSALSKWGSCDGVANQTPTAAMSWNCSGFDCNFDGGPSSDPDGIISTYEWDYGDGTTGSGVNPSHPFASAGSWQVNLIATDNDGASDNVTETVTVTEPMLVRGPYLQMQTDDGITIHWRTDISTDSVVRYGVSSDNLNNTTSNAGSRVDHAVALSGLGAGQQFWYSVGTSSAPIAGDATYRFETAPTQGNAADTRIWVLGDSGTANSNARAVRDAYKAWSASDPADLVLMLGDNAYNDGTDAEYQSAVFDTYPEILRQLPLWSALGNHDGHSADSASQSGPYYDIFNLPANGEIGGLMSGTEAYYSFDYANIHFVCLDSYETDRSPGGVMMTWLQNDLAMNTTQPWVIAFWHHPPYTKGSHDSDTEGQLIDMRENALPILEELGVDLVLSGHSHSYERSYLLDGHYGHSLTLDPDNNVLDPGDGKETGDGMYEKPDIIAAARAGSVYAVAGSSGKVSSAPLDHPAMFVSLASLGSLLVDVSGNQLDVVFIDQTGAVRDEFSIFKGPDFDAPLINGASAEDASHVSVNFNESIDLMEATIASNYAIAGLSVITTELLNDDRSVRLTTSAMTSGSSYTLVVNNIQDIALNTIIPDSQTSFDFVATMSASFQDSMQPSPSYDGTFDAYIREFSADTAHGLETTLQVDGSEPSGSETDMSIVLGWDISSIPNDATALSAEMQLEVTNASGGSYTCYSLLTSFSQSEVNWNQASSGTPWNTPGASSGSDRGSQSVCTVAASSTGSLTVSLNSDGLSLVQDWINNPSSNHGMIIASPTTSDGADFHSSESSTVLARPKLDVIYTVPTVPDNMEPVAGFTSSCSELDCNFTDTSTDGDGSITARDWDFGDGNSSTAQNPSHSYVTSGDYTVSLTVTDNDGDSDVFSDSVTASDPVPLVDHKAQADLPLAGTVNGTFHNTHEDDSTIQSITERESGGKKNGRFSYLSHSWRFTVSSASMVTVIANAWSGGSSDGDTFEFEWSTDNSNFNPLFTVSETHSSNVESAVIAASGTLYIRVTDTDQTLGNRAKDTVFIDHLIIRGDSSVPSDPPAAPVNMQVSSASSSTIQLSWEHDSTDEQNFDLQRKLFSSSTWTNLTGPGGGDTAHTDTDLNPSTSYDYRIRAANSAGPSNWSNTATGTTSAAAVIVISASGYKIKGKHTVDLTWSGAGSTNVDIVRNNAVVATVANAPGSYTDRIGTKGSATYFYAVCEAGTSICSDNFLVVF